MAWVRFVLWWMPYSCGFEACLNPTCEGVYVTAWINKCIKSGGKNSTQDLLSTHWVMVLPFDTDKNGWQSLGLKMSVAILRRRSEVVTQVPSSNPRQSWLYLDFSDNKSLWDLRWKKDAYIVFSFLFTPRCGFTSQHLLEFFKLSELWHSGRQTTASMCIWTVEQCRWAQQGSHIKSCKHDTRSIYQPSRSACLICLCCLEFI